MNNYFYETKWDAKKCKELYRVYQKGYVQHFATFYDKEALEKYMKYLNKEHS